MVYKGYNKIYDSRKFKTIRVFGNEIRNNIVNMYTGNYLTKFVKEFKTKTKPQNNYYLKKVKDDVIKSAMGLLKGREMVFKAFESGIFSKRKESE